MFINTQVFRFNIVWGEIMATAKMLTICTLIVVAVAVTLVVTTTGLLGANQTVPSTGIITGANICVYSDNACTMTQDSIDWGVLQPGDIETKTVYVENAGNTTLALTMETSEWNPPSANGPISLSWNRENFAISPNSHVSAHLTLSIEDTITDITNFNFNIIIGSSE
jgi:hypothetical protein